MANKDLTEIVLVVDRSGSMYTCRDEAQGGINAFIEDQKKLKGKANFTLVQFDSEYEFVHEGVDIQDVPEFTLHPRNSTALLDAVGRAISETGERLDKMDEKDKPGLVVFVITTDGDENSSTEYNSTQIKDMVTEQQDKYNWQFTFLGAGIDAFSAGGDMGYYKGGIANCNARTYGNTFVAASANVGRMRKMSSDSLDIENEYTKDELKSMVE
jgi:uncharacterized protein YegL